MRDIDQILMEEIMVDGATAKAQEYVNRINNGEKYEAVLQGANPWLKNKVDELIANGVDIDSERKKYDGVSADKLGGSQNVKQTQPTQPAQPAQPAVNQQKPQQTQQPKQLSLSALSQKLETFVKNNNTGVDGSRIGGLYDAIKKVNNPQDYYDLDVALDSAQSGDGKPLETLYKKYADQNNVKNRAIMVDKKENKMNKSDSILMEEIYTQLEEGWLERGKAALSQTWNTGNQMRKNLGTVVRAGGSAIMGDKQAAKKTISQVKDARLEGRYSGAKSLANSHTKILADQSGLVVSELGKLEQYYNDFMKDVSTRQYQKNMPDFSTLMSEIAKLKGQLNSIKSIIGLKSNNVKKQ